MIQQKELAKASDNKVLKALMQKSPQTWTQLVEATGLSTRTLRKALKRLEKQSLIYRKVDATGKYPPPVLYGLTPQGSKALAPIIFAIKSYNYALGLRLEAWNAKQTDKKVVLTQTLENELASLPLTKRLQIIGRRLFARALFSFLQTLKTGDSSWLENTNFSLTPELLVQFELFQKEDKALGHAQCIGEHGKDVVLKMDLSYRLEQLSSKIEAFEKALAEAFPEEYKQLQQILKECLKRE